MFVFGGGFIRFFKFCVWYFWVIICEFYKIWYRVDRGFVVFFGWIVFCFDKVFNFVVIFLGDFFWEGRSKNIWVFYIVIFYNVRLFEVVGFVEIVIFVFVFKKSNVSFYIINREWWKFWVCWIKMWFSGVLIWCVLWFCFSCYWIVIWFVFIFCFVVIRCVVVVIIFFVFIL